MAFEKRDYAKKYEPKDGDTFEKIPEREGSGANPVTWEELALYNWGTKDRAEIDALMRDEIGTRARDGDKHFVVSSDDEGPGRLLIPARFSATGFPLDKTHTIRVHRRTCPKQFLGCCSFPNVTFRFDSSFIRPEVVDHLKELETLVDENPDARIMVFGHTDAVGDDLYNKKLSERRAWSAWAFITNDTDAWETLYRPDDEEP